MSVTRYKVGHITPLRIDGQHVANGRIARRYIDEHGQVMIVAEVLQLSPSYAGTVKVGDPMTFSEDDPVQDGVSSVTAPAPRMRKT